MADTATLAIRVDASGAILPTQRLKGELESLGVSADKVQVKTRQFATNAAFGLSSLASSGARDITSILRSLSSLGFAFGVGVGVITLSISAIADMWSETRRKSKEAQDKMLTDFQAFAARFSLDATRVRIALLEIRDATLAGRIDAFGGTTDKNAPVAKSWVQERERIATQLGGLRLQELKLMQEQVKEAAKLAATEQKRLDAGDAALMEDELDVRKRVDADLARAKALEDSDKKFYEDRARMREDDARAQKVIDDEKERRAARIKAIWAGIALGGVTGVIGAVGGAAGGVVSGAIGAGVGAAAAGPWAIAAAGTLALVGGLFGLSKAAEEARARTRALRQALQDTLAVMEAGEGLEGSLIRVQQQFRELRLQAMTYYNFLKQGGGSAYKAEIDRINKLEAERVASLKAESAAMVQALADDVKVRLLRAQGRTEEADALDLALKQERELTKARRDGADAITLAALAEAQRIEKLNLQIGKIQARIESLAGTITSLQTFRDDLMLSDESLSPTKKLAEAQRQYDAILKEAKGDDVEKAQQAASRLPAAARTLLDLSRLVNASGSAYQKDFDKVLADNAKLIERFTDLKTIEELMLEELIRIRDNTHSIADVSDTIITTTATDVLKRTEDVTKTGFKELSTKLDTLTGGVDAVRRATKDVSDVLILGRR